MIRIVITDDQPIVLEGICLLLDRIDDFEVVAVYRNGMELVEHIQEITADIFLMDIDMPVMDGITATKHITSKYPDRKVIALSMHTDSKYYYDMITSGARGFVLKQSSIQELELAIREVFYGNNFFSNELLQNVIINMQNIQVKNQQKWRIPQLTKKEIDLLTFICQGLSNKELAEKLFVSVKTVESQKAKLMDKTGARNTAGLIIWALKNKVISL